MPYRASPFFRSIADRAAAEGMNLCGAVGAPVFDASQPCGRRAKERRADVGTILLLGSGGRDAFETVTRRNGGRLQPAAPDYHPIDTWSAEVAEEIRTVLAQRGYPSSIARPDDKDAMNFRQLAEMCGLGSVSPVIGHFLHPVFGPWVSLRIALLVRGEPFGALPREVVDFDPCAECARPCVDACPVRVYDGSGATDLCACANHRLASGCADGCAVLHACPVGREHRYTAEEEAFRGAYSMFAIRRWLGVGAWKLVPERLRRSL
ncbi:MAG: hypothetical protein AB7I19_10050 [Planctomycetota bacterium]